MGLGLGSGLGVWVSTLASVMESRPTEPNDHVERLGSISLWKESFSCIFLGFCLPMPSKEKLSFVKVTTSLSTLSTVTGPSIRDEYLTFK